VLGTLVWDRIVPAGGAAAIEAWGGMAYAVSSAAASLDPGWAVLPIVKVGADLAPEALRYFEGIPRVDGSCVTVVPEPNNRVDLLYRDRAERTERLSGGVPSWGWPELEPLVHRCDALLVNFISGQELDLRTCRSLRAGFDGPLFGDLHSLFLGVAPDGTRVPRPLDDPGAWISCFDVIQLNESEAGLASSSGADPETFARDALGADPRTVVVTLGARGAVWATRRGEGEAGARTVTGSVTIRVPRQGDPTGCGDVWGAAFFARLLAGDAVDVAARFATGFAERNVTHRGAEGLYDILTREVSL
jgi:sugar/nucleoside kinase (ribokinase family)